MDHKTKVKIIKDWLNHQGWEIILAELSAEANEISTKLIDTDDDDIARSLRYELRMHKRFINKLVNYSKMSPEA